MSRKKKSPKVSTVDRCESARDDLTADHNHHGPGRNRSVSARTRALISREPSLGELRRRLLDRGGDEVVLAEAEFGLQALLDRGRDFSTDGLSLRKMAPSQCHNNAAQLRLDSPGSIGIGTGYALSSDGLWRQHSWSVEEGRIVETTVARIHYFGITLGLAETARFIVQNLPPARVALVLGAARSGPRLGDQTAVEGGASSRVSTLHREPHGRDRPETYCPHEWVVFSTALQEGWLMIQCVTCGTHGAVEDPSEEEWSAAFHAPSRPYRWSDASRVVVKGPGSAHVMRAGGGRKCDCNARTNRPEPLDYERLPAEIMSPVLQLSDEDRTELLDWAGFVALSDLCSLYFSHFVRSFGADTGDGVPAALEAIAARIERIDRMGLHCSPSVVARVLRDLAATS